MAEGKNVQSQLESYRGEAEKKLSSAVSIIPSEQAQIHGAY